MEVYRTVEKIQSAIEKRKGMGHRIGFVPTMGALHNGHKSLLTRARSENETVVCSIFVNPTQFNEKKDLDHYPRTLDTDVELLQQVPTDLLFYPYTIEVYPPRSDKEEKLDLGELGRVLEAVHRPGHFDGVIQVVKRLLEIIDSDNLYMGQKDFQQQAIIQYMIEWYKLPVHLKVCPIIREENGLAMSSRNERLPKSDREKAGVIHKSLCHIRDQWNPDHVSSLREYAIQKINRGPFNVEYLEIVDGDSLASNDDFATSDVIVACAAVWAGDVRLIDNLIIKDTVASFTN